MWGYLTSLLWKIETKYRNLQRIWWRQMQEVNETIDDWTPLNTSWKHMNSAMFQKNICFLSLAGFSSSKDTDPSISYKKQASVQVVKMTEDGTEWLCLWASGMRNTLPWDIQAPSKWARLTKRGPFWGLFRGLLSWRTGGVGSTGLSGWSLPALGRAPTSCQPASVSQDRQEDLNMRPPRY